MQKNISLYTTFTKKMLILAISIGVLTAITMPLCYFILSWSQEKEQADYLSRQVSPKVIEAVRDNPELWMFSVQKFTEIYSGVEKGIISQIRVYDANGSLVLNETLSKPSIFDRRGYSDIIYNNVHFGWIEVSKITRGMLLRTALLFILFSLLGVAIAFVLYRFPANIIRKAELEINDNLERLNHLSYFDQLTELRNRAYLNEILPKFINDKKKFTIIFIDIDNFKHINDTFGHSFGDSLLKKLGGRLRLIFRARDIVIRLGGDEFMIILPNMVEKKLLVDVARRLVDSFGSPLIVDDNELFITASFGIAIHPNDGENMAALMKNADIAMYAAKKQGKNTYCFYRKDISTDTSERLRIGNQLCQAIERNELQLHFQPKFDIYSFKMIGCEILLRWLHPEMGMISPGIFIPIAEETGQIVPIGEWVLLNSFKQIKEWTDTYDFLDIRFSINISPLQFEQDNLIDFIKYSLYEIDLDPKYIELEITESIAMQNADDVYRKLNQIRKLGIEISIDDFGTGYSSMSYLKKYPINTLKIAMPFVKDIINDKGNEAIVTAIIALARSLGLKVIAEGVETEEQLEKLREKSCDYGQGYFYSKALNTNDFIQFAAKNSEETVCTYLKYNSRLGESLQ